MEGGAHVVHEAIVSGTPVLASRIDGNVGMLGTGYSGYFDWNDADGLARLLVTCRKSPNFLGQLRSQITERARLFAPEAECAAVRRLAAELLLSRD
jgi:glycosyltransferase involved in cell wall biosynthesis